MRLLTLEIIFLAFITISEEGRVNANSLDSRQTTVLQGRISEEGRQDMPVAAEEKDNAVDVQENNIVENQDKLLVLNNDIDLANKNKYIIHHRGNRKYLADNYGEEHSDISDNNHDGEEGDVYGKVDDPSKEHLDYSIRSSIISKEATEYQVKEFGKLINEKENMNTENSESNHQGETLENDNSMKNSNIYKELSDINNPTGNTSNHEYMEVSVQQSLNHEQEAAGINKESDNYDNDINDDIHEDDDESYISPNEESFWDAVDTFINMNPYSEDYENEDPEDPEDLYDYLYTPSGNSPGIDHFLDLLHFVKDVGDAVERIEKDIKPTGGKDPVISPLNISYKDEVDKKMTKKVDNQMSHEGYRIDQNAEKTAREIFSRSKRSDSKESDKETKIYQHKPFGSSLGIRFPLFTFDLLFSRFIFEPFADPYPDGE